MSGKKRERSISQRIVRAWTMRTAFTLIAADVVFAALFAGRGVKIPFSWRDPVFAGAEILLLLFARRAAKRKARRYIAPLERMAQTAQEISSAGFDQQRLKQLEDAIDTLPVNPGARLSTGDRELKGLEEAINDLLTRMNESLQARGRFVSDASHELRTPISVIQGYADMLQRWGKDDGKVLDEGISAIQSATAHMKKLVEQLLFLARGDADRNRMNTEDLDLKAMISEVYEESRMIYPEHEWKLDADKPVPARGDTDMLKQAARILVDNAAKYSGADTRITLRAYEKDGDVCFEVQDNGIGIPAGALPHIFDRFYRADPARSRATGGTGLGLSIAQWIVEKHGGYFNVFSREEIGTRISVLLPAAGKAPERADAPEAHAHHAEK